MSATVKTPARMQIDTGIQESSRQTIADGLSRVLADSWTLYLKTLNFHWNVTGPYFSPLHALFEDQYTDLAAASDEVAERIRALGFNAPGSYKSFARLTQIEDSEEVPGWQDMIRELVKGHETIIRTAREVFPEAEKAGDEVTADLLIGRMQTHEKTAWMLRSHLED